jgi:hypothetical protein
MASQSDGEQQLQSAAVQVISGAPWQTASGGSATESLTQSLVEALKDATNSVNSLAAIQQNQVESTAENTQAVLTSVAGGQSVLGMAASTAGGVADSLLSGGSLLSPIISGIMSLFGSGGSSAPPPPLTTFTMPPAVNVDATGGQMTSGQLAGSDYGSNGLPRAQTTSDVTLEMMGGQLAGSEYGGNGLPRVQTTSNVTVQVNAMDSRSFLDRSNDIATAVRQAILSSHSLNDVLSEL